MKKHMRVIADPKLQVILEKCLDADRAMELCLFEGSVSRLITEELDEADIKKVRSALEDARKAAAAITKYVSGLGVALPQVTEYVTGIENALNVAQGELALISFADSDPVAQAWGGKVTLPRIVKAVATLYTKATDFTTGFTNMMQTIQSGLKPLADASSETETDKEWPPPGSLKSNAGKNGIPDGNKLYAGIVKALTKAFKGGYLARIKNFFGKSKIGSVEKKIMDAIPDITEDMINDMSRDIMEIPLSKLFQPLPKVDQNPSDEIGEPAKAAEAELEQESPEASVANAEQEDSGQEDSGGEDGGSDGTPVISKQAFIDLIKKSPRMGQSKRGGKQQRLKFKQAVNKAAGKTIFEEGLLTGHRRTKQNVSDKDVEMFSRWKTLAGVTD